MPDAPFPALDVDRFVAPDATRLVVPRSTHAPRILLLYGSLRERSYSRFLTLEAARLLETTHWQGDLKKINGDNLVFQMPRELIPDLNRALVELQIPVLSLQAKTSLEDYFLSLTRSKQYVAAFTD